LITLLKRLQREINRAALVWLAHVTARRPATADSNGMETPKTREIRIPSKTTG